MKLHFIRIIVLYSKVWAVGLCNVVAMLPKTCFCVIAEALVGAPPTVSIPRTKTEGAKR